MIRLDALHIQNFRCIGEGTITFNRDVTVLVADNGIGKTTVLDAASLVLSQFVDELTKTLRNNNKFQSTTKSEPKKNVETRQSPGLLPTDVRLASFDGSPQSPRTPTILQATGDFDGRRVEWIVRRTYYDQTPRRSPKDLADVTTMTNDVDSAVSTATLPDHDVVLPIVAYYRSNRFALNTFFGNSSHRRVGSLDGRLSGYRIYLEPLSDSMHFNKWYRRLVLDVKNAPVTGAKRSTSSLQQLAAVNEAVGKVLAPTDWHHIDWDETQQCVTARHPIHGTLPLAVLSSGIRTTIAVAADIAHRCARLNPHLAENIARMTPGVILIDEVDLHLHPAWQQLIVDLLRTAFPSAQFILSTHSPQVLSTIDASAIRVIKLCNGIAEMKPPRLQTRGVESADVLARVMDVDPIPKVQQAEWLSSYRALVQAGAHESDEGKNLWAQLLGHFGAEHPVLTEIDTIRRFHDFKRENNIPLN